MAGSRRPSAGTAEFQASRRYSHRSSLVGEDENSPNERLAKLLGYGRFQKFQAWVFCGILSWVGAWNMYQLIFAVTRKPFRCSLPETIESG